MNSILYRSQAVDSVAMAVRKAGWCGAESGYITLLHSFPFGSDAPNGEQLLYPSSVQS